VCIDSFRMSQDTDTYTVPPTYMQVYDQIAWNMLVVVHMDNMDDAHGAWVDMSEHWTNRRLGGPPDPGADPSYELHA
jgi:hypothetical protein